MRYLRAKTNGFVFEYHERLAMLPDWEEVTEQEAFPERFAPVDLATFEPQVDISVPEEVTIAPVVVSEELEAEATKSLERKIGTPRTKAAPAKASFDVAGLKGAF